MFSFLVPRKNHTGAPCVCCGANAYRQTAVLWPDLVGAWGLSDAEVAYINRQQGYQCVKCNNNLRSQALALAILRFFAFDGTLLQFTESSNSTVRVLEINRAGELTPILSRMPNHVLCEYPAVDMTCMPFKDGDFDLVIHSDTLEHVPDPIAGLRECRRVLRSRGACIYTVPIIVGRLSRRRTGLPASYHGSPANPEDCRVISEYGADVWAEVINSGFMECRITALEYPSAFALTAIR